MDLSELLHVLNFPAYFKGNLVKVRLKERSSSWPVISAEEGISETEKAAIFDPSVIHELEKRLGLRFELEAIRGGRVCFANTEEVRPDFRTTFSGSDLLNFCFSQLPSSGKPEAGEIYLPFPEDPDHFWELVEEGQKKKQGR